MVAAWKFDLFVAVGPHMKVAADAALAAGTDTVHFEDTAAACAGIADLLQPADSVLLKGSRGMALETLLNPLGKGPALAAAKR
jgi:UDP-N-acetylmuramyl pentapeptide synthase